MLGINSPREPIAPQFAKEIRAAFWRSSTGHLTEKERERRRRCRKASQQWKIEWK